MRFMEVKFTVEMRALVPLDVELTREQVADLEWEDFASQMAEATRGQLCKTDPSTGTRVEGTLVGDATARVLEV